MSLLRRRMMMAKKLLSVGFPATLIYWDTLYGENVANYDIAMYIIDKYPNMVVGKFGSTYTSITEDITIVGTRNCDGKVLGVKKWSNEDNNLAVLFFTQQGNNNLECLRVAVDYGSDPKGATLEWFFD